MRQRQKGLDLRALSANKSGVNFCWIVAFPRLVALGRQVKFAGDAKWLG
jgi:hypothetical protein